MLYSERNNKETGGRKIITNMTVEDLSFKAYFKDLLKHKTYVLNIHTVYYNYFMKKTKCLCFSTKASTHNSE